MPRANFFRHQAYRTSRPSSPHHLIKPGPHPPVDSDQFNRRMLNVGRALREANIAVIYLVHGTFVGVDTLGVLAELARLFPKASKAVRRVIKHVVDQITGDVGNYTGGYAACFESAINPPGEPAIPVRRFHWSSENHHIGRADGTVRLVYELGTLRLRPGQRVLLWGHSHAGNVFALMTNLLSGNREAISRFFEAAEIYYQWPLVGCVDIPIWTRVRELLLTDRPPLADAPPDIVTFGTPIRYGWESAGYNQLLHFVNHRPHEGVPEYRAPFPPELNDVMQAADGDYVQQLGIAGTNIMPSVFAWRSRMAENRLNRLLQPDLPEVDPLAHFQAGAIVPDEGTTLLVDYGPSEGSIARHYAGHAVYTNKSWLLFHAEEVVRRFYNSP